MKLSLIKMMPLYIMTHGTYTSCLDRGGLKIPSDTVCEWIFMSYILFNYIGVDSICRYSVASLFIDIAYAHGFPKIERRHGNILANIFFNNYCHLHTLGSDKEPKLKVLKLST